MTHTVVSRVGEDWQARCDRIHREWTRLAKLARAWCNARGHSMGPLHAQHQDAPLDASRRMRCRRCNMLAWVHMSGEPLRGYPSYSDCPARRR